MILIGIALALIVSVGIIDGVCYCWLTPTPPAPPARLSPHWRAWMVRGLHTAAYVLALLRLPFALLPYLAKLSLYLIMGERFAPWWQSIPIQVLRWVGDFANLGVTATILLGLATARPAPVAIIMNAAIGAEMVRLILEKGQMAVSVAWQYLPHRRLAQSLRRSGLRRVCRPYIFYYRLSDQGRLTYIMRLLRHWGTSQPATEARLRYVRAFRVVDPRSDLRTGQVRDVARGEIFVHPLWSNDPWLLIGLALRRSPWVFDPRYLRRPAYYRTELNPRATRFVLEHAHFTPPFALYQLGHEIKAARFEIFFRCCRALGFNLEAPLVADGTYQFDPALAWLAAQLGRAVPPHSRPLWNDAEVLVALAQDPEAGSLSIEDIATRYTYPRIYVEEISFPAIRQVAANPPEAMSDASGSR